MRRDPIWSSHPHAQAAAGCLLLLGGLVAAGLLLWIAWRLL